jgi:hypothetical protein
LSNANVNKLYCVLLLLLLLLLLLSCHSAAVHTKQVTIDTHKPNSTKTVHTIQYKALLLGQLPANSLSQTGSVWATIVADSRSAQVAWRTLPVLSGFSRTLGSSRWELVKCAVCVVVCGNGVAGIGGNLLCGSGTEPTVVSLTALCRRAVRQETLFVDWSVRKTPTVRKSRN